MKKILHNKLTNLPHAPGVYQFLNEKGKIIYVGKAKNLNNRVKSYFQNNIISPKTRALVDKISDIIQIIAETPGGTTSNTY